MKANGSRKSKEWSSKPKKIVRDGEKVKMGQGSLRKELVNSLGWHKGQ